MAETFSFCTRVGATGEIKQRVWENDFGDGYSQSGGTGINNKTQEWSHKAVGSLAAGQELRLMRDFLDRHEGYKSFFWTPPGGTQGGTRPTATSSTRKAPGFSRSASQ